MTYTIITWRDAVLASHLKAAQKVVLLTLQRYADAKTGECWPAAATVSEFCHVARASVHRTWGVAEKAGLLKKRPGFNHLGQRTSNRFTLTVPPVEVQGPALNPSGAHAEKVRGMPRIGQSNKPENKSGNKPENKEQSSSTSHPERSMPQTHPSDGGANEEYEMTDDDRRPSDNFGQDDIRCGDCGQWCSDPSPAQYCPRHPRPETSEPLDNVEQLPKRPITAETLDACDALLAENGFAVEEQSSLGLEHLPTRVHHMPIAGNMVTDIKNLRAETGLPIHACKTALEDAHGDLAAATVALKRHRSYIEPLEHVTTPGPHHLTSAAQMRADLTRPVPQFKGCIPRSETIAMTGYERINQVDVLTHRARWKQVAGRHWKGPWDAWLNQFLPYMTDDQHQAWMAAVLKADNVPNMPWNTTTVIGIMSGEKRQQRGKGYGGGQR